MAISDLLRPKWKHSDPLVRRRAVDDLSAHDIDVLEAIVRHDDDPGIRLAAVKRIQDQSVLERLAATDADRDVLQAVTTKLDELMVESVLHNQDEGQRLAALGRVGNEELLAQIVVESTCAAVRVAAFKRVSCAHTILRLLTQPLGKELGLCGIERLGDEALLEKAVDQASNKAVRRRAQEKLDAIRSERNRPGVEEQRSTELTALCEEAERLQDSWNWDYVNKSLEAADGTWQRFDPTKQHELRARFEAAERHFKDRHAAFLERQAEEAEKAEARAKTQQAADALCRQLEDLVGATDAVADEHMARIDTEWSELELPEDDELITRFNKAKNDFEAQKKAAEEAAATRATALEKLGRLCDDAEQAAQDSDLPKAVAVCGRLQKRWTQLTEGLSDIDEWAARFNSAQHRVKERDAERRAAEEAAAAELTAKLTALCDAVDAHLKAENVMSVIKEVQALQAEWKEAVAGKSADRALDKRFRQAGNEFFQKVRDQRQNQKWEQWANLNVKEELCSQAVALEQEADVHKLAEQVKALQKRWKEIGPVPRDKSDEIWQRFHGACDKAYGRCKAFYAERNAERQEHLAAKEALCEQAESLVDSEDWSATADKLKALQKEWGEIGEVPREAVASVEKRFRSACHQFFENRRNHFDQLAQAKSENTKRKTELVEQAESLQESSEWQDTATTLRELQADWKTIGPGQKEHEQDLWQRFQSACNKFFERLDEQRPANLAAKEALCEEVEALLANDDENQNRSAIAAKLTELQRRWQTIGPVPKEAGDVHKRFRSQCDAFFAKRREAFAQLAEERERNQAEKEEILYQLESLSDSTEWEETAREIKTLQGRWNEIGPAPRSNEEELRKRFRETCDRFFSSRRAHYGELAASREDNLAEKEAICLRLEMLAGIGGRDEEKAAPSKLSIADELKIAFESNFVIGEQAGNHNSQESTMSEVRKLQAKWREVGPVPREAHGAIEGRYRRACDEFYAQRRKQAPTVSPEEMAANLKAKQEICEEVERCAAAANPKEQLPTIRRCQKRWKTIGRIKSKKEADALWQRYKNACDIVYAAVRADEPES